MLVEDQPVMATSQEERGVNIVRDENAAST
jgi:hypothetical protein